MVQAYILVSLVKKYLAEKTLMKEGRETPHTEKYEIMNYWYYDDSCIITLPQSET
jgi:hypothetical protein